MGTPRCWPVIRVPSSIRPNDVVRVRALVIHPMEIIQRRDGKVVEKNYHFINKGVATYLGKPIVEFAARFDDLLSALIQRQPDNSQVQLALARKLAERGKHLLAEKQPVTPVMAVRLGAVFETSAASWLRMQTAHRTRAET